METQLKEGDQKRFLPSQAKYTAIAEDQVTKLIKITYQDLKKVATEAQMYHLGSQFKTDIPLDKKIHRHDKHDGPVDLQIKKYQTTN